MTGFHETANKQRHCEIAPFKTPVVLSDRPETGNRSPVHSHDRSPVHSHDSVDRRLKIGVS